jgi:hypothetical protein
MIDRLRQGDRVLALLQEEYPEYHPLIGVARIAHTTDDERLKFDCHKTLCEYVEPKLKSVEVQQSFSEDSELRVVFEGEYSDVTPAPEPPAIIDDRVNERGDEAVLALMSDEVTIPDNDRRVSDGNSG